MTDALSQPIFILGLMPRSGTHFLGNLLCLHPDCVKSVLAEDSLTAHAHLLAQYVDRLQRDWARTMGGNSPVDPADLYECLGDGLMALLSRTRHKVTEARARQSPRLRASGVDARRLVTKSPWVTNLELFFPLFPRAQLVVLVRNGPDTVESYVRSGFTPSVEGDVYEDAMRHWVAGARAVLRAQETRADRADRWRIVRYEDLHAHTEDEMERLLAFLALDSARYDMGASRQVPVVGSSVFKRGDGPVHWLPVGKTAEFDPLARSSGWTTELRARFHDLAGAESRALGYE